MSSAAEITSQTPCVLPLPPLLPLPQSTNPSLRLSSLSDAQLASLGQAAREESTRDQPLLAPQESLDALEQEYLKGGNAEFAGKIRWLRETAGFVGE